MPPNLGCFSSPAVANQGVLEQALRTLFVGEKVNSRKESLIKHPTSNSFLEIDIRIPDLKLCFEFQDVYHYTTTWDSHLPLQEDQLVRESGDTLIAVPCWWDGQIDSLVGNIQFVRPDIHFPLFQKNVPLFPTPLNPEPNFIKFGILPGVGEVMLASFPSLQHFPPITLENTWWLGEKYDGLELKFPEVFIDAIESHGIFMEGEVWFGRGSFPESQKLLHSSPNIDWSMLRLIAFDKPDLETHNLEYEERYSLLLYSSLLNDIPFTIVAFRLLCATQANLEKLLKFEIDSGGEGLILNQPYSEYENGRSTSLIKLKANRGDKEALIVAETETALTLKLPDGETFQVAKKDAILIPTPKRGDIITFSYDNYTRRSVPVNPVIRRVRSDLTWEQVVSQDNDLQNLSSGTSLEERSYRAVEFAAKPPKFWSSDKKRNMRLFFESIAKKSQFDPLVAKNWYGVERETVLQAKGGRYILGRYQGSLVRALQDLFPDIGLDTRNFSAMPRRHWQNTENRKQFFDGFAEQHGFDPLYAENWYDVETIATKAIPGGSSTMRYYGGNLAKALLHTYPDIGLDPQKLIKRQYEVTTNRRRFFEQYAKESGFDPLVPFNWYGVPASDITNRKGGTAVLYYYQGSFVKALLALFPDIGLDPNQLSLPRHYWQDENNQRGFFVQYAKERGLDPLSPATWYQVKTRSLVQQKGSTIIMQIFKGSFIKALVQLFPGVKFETSQFKYCT